MEAQFDLGQALNNLKTFGKNDTSDKIIPLTTIKSFLESSTSQIQICKIVNHLSNLFQLSSHKSQQVKDLANEVANLFLTKLSSNSLGQILPYLFDSLKIENQWQTRVLGLELLNKSADLSPSQVSVYLPEIIPEVTGCMNDVKKNIKDASFVTMTSCCDVVGNKDIEHMTTHIVKAIQTPSEVPELMHKLAGVVFVQSVKSSALAMVVPLLMRGLIVNLNATKRQSAVIIENMSKLVDDPLDAMPFLPKLLPALTHAHDAISDPEARTVLERALKQLQKLSTTCENLKSHAVNLDKISEILCAKTEFDGDTLTQLKYIIDSLIRQRDFTNESWKEVENILTEIKGEFGETIASELQQEFKNMMKIEEEEDNDDAELLCDCQFTLAYGTKILLHNTNLKLRRGKRYALLSKAQGGKSTFMKSIANNSLEGFPGPDVVRTVFVKPDIIGELSHLNCVDYMLQNENLKHMSKEDLTMALNTMGFTESSPAKPTTPVGLLSGGWRAKLSLITAMLQKPDVLLLDNPSSHLDVINLAFVKNYLNSLTKVTCIMTSNDIPFLRECCTNVIQVDNLKLHQYGTGIDGFLAKNPDSKEYFSMTETTMKFKFPKPSDIQGVKSRSKALMKMSDVTFTYPTNTVPTVKNINLQVSMISKIAIVGPNGGGKSTTIKLLIGELEASTGKVERNPNVRVAYISQYSFEQINKHLDKTANEYIRYRYSGGDDKESIEKTSVVLTPDEEKLQKETFELIWKTEEGETKKSMKRIVKLLGNRKEVKGSGYEYDVQFADGTEMFVPLQILEKRGWGKLTKVLDVKIAQLAGKYIRTLSSANVESHLQDCGLDPEKATHTRLSALADSEKCMAVIAACTWSQPHILIFDEPTNYLSNDLLNGFAQGLLEFEGGYVIISHNNEFTKQVCKTEWHIDDGNLVITGENEANWMDKQENKIEAIKMETQNIDNMGNVTEIKQKKILSKKEIKERTKIVSKKLKDGDELNDDDYDFAVENKLI